MVGDERDPDRDEASYVFSVRFRVEPTSASLTLDPETFETMLFRRADPPGEEGWLFFQTHLWRGELTAPQHFRERTERRLGVPVESVAFRELRTGREYLETLEDAVAEDLSRFNAETVEETLKKYFGSSIHVVSE